MNAILVGRAAGRQRRDIRRTPSQPGCALERQPDASEARAAAAGLATLELEALCIGKSLHQERQVFRHGAASQPGMHHQH